MCVDKSAKILWEYMHMKHSIEKADCIIVLGSHDRRVAERGAELFLQAYAPYIVFSGYLGALTSGKWEIPEAEIFAEIAAKMGVPEDRILIESKSTNTGENVSFTRSLLTCRGINPESAIVVHKPYAERRAYVTFQKVWPELKVRITSPGYSYENYPNEEITKEHAINIMVGDFQRVMVYPQKGYSIPQIIPNYVMEAYRDLVEKGYDRHMLKEFCYNN